MTNAPEPLDPSFQLKLPAFEGPLDLLLFLVQKHDLEILDLPVAFVTERYLEYLGLMQEMNLDIAAEYLVMAATLAFIKSKMLLPPDPTAADESEPEEEIDPRAELIRRLLEYQKYKQAAEDLASRGMTGRDVFLRGMEAPEALGEAPLASFGLFKLLDAFKAVLERSNKQTSFAVTHEGIGIHDRMRQLVDRLAKLRSCRFEELFDDAATVYDLVVTFLAILEMAKRRLARVYQSEPIAPIHLEYTVLAEGEVDDVLAEPTTAGGEDEDEVADAARTDAQERAEAEADRAVAEPGEDPLGPARDPEEVLAEPATSGGEDEDAPATPSEVEAERLDAEADGAVAEPDAKDIGAEPSSPASGDGSVPGPDEEKEVPATTSADEEERLEAEADRAVAEPGEDPLGPALDSEEDFSQSGAPERADPSASDDE